MAPKYNNLPPLIVILGPTSVGKTALSLELAQELSGEIVSADSRQVYRGLDIGTNKVTVAEQESIPHHLIDVIDPADQMTIAEYKKLADAAIKDIYARGRVPFLVGGSPLYIFSVVDNYLIPEIAPNPEYRAELEAMPDSERLALLEKLDPQTFAVIDQKNPRRVIRALEVVKVTGESFTALKQKGDSQYHALLIGIDRPREELYVRIDASAEERLKRGLIEEVQELLDSSISSERLRSFGLEYRFVTAFLLGELSRAEAVQRLKYATHDFARRQLTWFRKDNRIHWVKTTQEAHILAIDFLKKP